MSGQISKKAESTFDKLMKDKNNRELFNKEYSSFLLSDFVLEAMQDKKMSVRKLSEESGVSTSIIQNIRSGVTTNVTLDTLSSLAACLGYTIGFIKRDEE